MIVDCAHYRGGHRQHEGAMALDEAAARTRTEGFVWLGMFEPSADELERVQQAFGLHELAVEDATTFHLRPKVEQYDNGVLLVILRTASYDPAHGEIDTGEISLFIAEKYLITVRRGVASDLHGARLRLEHHPDLLEVGTTAAVWAILDHVVDGYAPVVAALEGHIEEIEGTVFSGDVAPTEQIYRLRREVSDFYRAVHPLVPVVSRYTSDGTARVLVPYFRDVHDHLILVNEEVAAQRDVLTTVLQANIAVISVEMNRTILRQSGTMEQLTAFATVFLPLSFVVGFFGQNFGWLVDNINGFSEFAILGIGGVWVASVLVYLWLRANRRRAREAVPSHPRKA